MMATIQSVGTFNEAGHHKAVVLVYQEEAEADDCGEKDQAGDVFGADEQGPGVDEYCAIEAAEGLGEDVANRPCGIAVARRNKEASGIWYIPAASGVTVRKRTSCRNAGT